MAQRSERFQVPSALKSNTMSCEKGWTSSPVLHISLVFDMKQFRVVFYDYRLPHFISWGRSSRTGNISRIIYYHTTRTCWRWMSFLVQDGFHWPANLSPAANGTSWESPRSQKSAPFFPQIPFAIKLQLRVIAVDTRLGANRHVYIISHMIFYNAREKMAHCSMAQSGGQKHQTVFPLIGCIALESQRQRFWAGTHFGSLRTADAARWTNLRPLPWLASVLGSRHKCIYQLIDKDVLLKERVSHPPSAPSAPSALLLHKWMTNPGQIYLSSPLSSFIKCLSPRRWLTIYDLRVEEEGGGPGQLGALQISFFPF